MGQAIRNSGTNPLLSQNRRDRLGPARAPILVADGHALFATAMRMALRARGVAACELPVEDSPTIVAAAACFPTGVVLLDLALCAPTAPRPSGPEHRPAARPVPDPGDLVWALRAQGKQVVAITGIEHEPVAAAAIVAGAVTVLPKTITFEALLDTLERTSADRPVLSESDLRYWRERHHRHVRYHHAVAERLGRLSPEESLVLDHLARGQRAAQIAEHEHVSLSTVRTQIRAILSKLGVGCQLEAVALLIATTPRRLEHSGGGERPGPDYRNNRVSRPVAG